MNKEFCIQCGFKNVFEVSRPKFCAGCGKPFNTTTKVNSAEKKVIRSHNQEDDFDEEFNLDDIDISKLKKSISYEGFNKNLTLDDLWSNPAPRDGFKRDGFLGPEGDELLAQIRKECSTSKVTEISDE
jgi:hypothetical protein